MVDSGDVPTQEEAEKALQKPRETAKQDDQEVRILCNNNRENNV